MSTAVDLKTKEEKDAELDRRIEALRKKNEALVRRYQEIEEDKKKAEQEGIAVTTPRKPRSHEAESDRRRTEKENLTITVDVSKPAGEKRIINERKPGAPRGGVTPEEADPAAIQGESSPKKPGSGRLSRGGPRGGVWQDRKEARQNKQEVKQDKAESRPDRSPREGEPRDGQGWPERTPRGGRRGRGGGPPGGGPPGGGPPGGAGSDRKSKEWEEKRRQNIEKVNEEMEKIAEYERGQRGEGEKNPVRNFLDDPRRCGPVPEGDRKEGSRRHVRNWGGLDFDNVKTGPELEQEWRSRRPGTKGSMDMTMSMTGRERAEYLRWKKEREQIDEERLARHRNATGQWRREWDAQKTDSMFKEEPVAEDVQDQGIKREENKRPPKAPTFGDFLGHGKPKEGVLGSRGRGRGHAKSKNYSMHDNRWEGETEKVPTDEEDKKLPAKEKVDVVMNSSTDTATGDDEDEWEDASDGEEETAEEDAEEGVEKVAASPEEAKEKPSSPPPAASPVSPKEQRTPRPKVQLPTQQDTPDPTKPLSPFSPLEGYQPVTDWGEAMEMQSPRSSLGESPLKPDSTGIESSPEQQTANGTAVPEESQTPSSPEKEDEAEEADTVTPSPCPVATETKLEEEGADLDSQTQEAAPDGDPDTLPSCPSEEEERAAAPPLAESLQSSKAEAHDSDPDPVTVSEPSEPSSG
ncbi:coiled-coil domain-containing protein 9 isoform X2 [Brienomyrus brachyistius]|uniref:coiled-coil domain-containing protein 9 isoform X2 n=1 Tax=Brienomyrus brachyistius TaxID=42636 RepID=UPI0020B41BC7|nr:coiled-coil domain-containing protein 9 isoform X2 [Brienomyrus brachyistius]